MPISAVDAISPAFEHARQQLPRPFRAGQWAKLGLVGLLAGEMGSGGGGCNPGSFQMPSRPNNSQHLLLPLPSVNPMVYASLIAVLVVTGLVLLVLFLYVNSVMRFVLFDSVVAKDCRIWHSWSRRQGPGRRFFVWQILLAVASIVVFDHSGRNPGRLCFPGGLAQRSQGAHDPADSGRHGPVFCASAFCGRRSC